jgi:hypothetical protein
MICMPFVCSRLPRVLLVVLVLALSGSTTQADLIYTLEPGSTITPLGGSPEALTGSFSWVEFDTGVSSEVGFDATALLFQSQSYTIALNQTPLNDVGTSLFAGTGVTFFEELVDATRPQVPELILGLGTAGSFEGPIHNPSRVIYSNLLLGPLSGGTVQATVSFSAVQVPEPTSLSLLVLGAMGLLARYRPRGGATRGGRGAGGR